MVHANRLRPFKDMPREKMEALDAALLDEFYVKKIIRHYGVGKNPKKWKFWVRWLDYEPEADTMIDRGAVQDLAALNEYSKENLHLNLRWIDVLGVKSGRIIEKNTGFHGVLQNPRYL